MIKESNGLFVIDTDDTTYAFRITQEGIAEHLYYGPTIETAGYEEDCARAMCEKVSHGKGSTINYRKGSLTVLEDMLLECSSIGKGDFRDPFIILEYEDGSSTSDFIYEGFKITQGDISYGLPTAYDAEENLELTLKEAVKDVHLKLIYSVYPESNVITRRAVVENGSENKLRISRIMSCQLDLDGNDYKVISFGGNWAREMEKTETVLEHGSYVNHTITGTSSNRNNPFIMLAKKDSGENHGLTYGMNLVYSADHYESVQVSAFYKTRFLSGIDYTDFSWELMPGDKFEAPEAVMTVSPHGYSGISVNMHDFVRKHIVRGKFRDELRPILLNSWEAAYFDINEAKLCKLAKKAADAGIELFVMDDGWFKGRNDDKTSLGDWIVDKKKLPGGIKGLSDKIHEMGLKFGIWVEPEMISEDSDLFRSHPGYAMRAPGRENSPGRNQMMLDFTNPEVVLFVKNALREVFTDNGIDYVKWDMNRLVSDVYSSVLPADRQRETMHRWMMGVYDVMSTIMTEFPDILFEGCSSGGNRFDLGILCYFPQIWASDDTDAIMRTHIQNGYSYGYPMSVVTAHVSDCPNHQTLRNTPLYTRFNIASFGVLGYEINLCDIKNEEYEEIKKEILQYKKWREVFFFGDFYRVDENSWMVVDNIKSRAVYITWNELCKPNVFCRIMKTVGLDCEKEYHVYNIPMKHNLKEFGDLVNMVAPVHVKKDSLVHNALAKFVKMDGETEDYILPGSVLNNAGIKLSQAFGGTGYDNSTRLFQDFASRMYFIEEI